MPEVLSPAQWAEVRSLAEQGVSYSVLSVKYGVESRQLENRSYYEGWLTPARVKARLSTINKSFSGEGVNSAPSRLCDSEKVTLTLAETWAQKGESLRNLSFETAVNAIKRSKDLITIETAADLKAAVHVARQAAGLDADAPAVSLNLYGGTGGGFFEAAGPVIEAEEPEGPLTLEGAGI